MNWKPTRGQKPDLPDNQILNGITKSGIVIDNNAKSIEWRNVLFYRESPVLWSEIEFTPITNNQRPEGLHDKDEIELLYASGNSVEKTVDDCNWGGPYATIKLFYRLTKKYQEPKPSRVGELMTFEEWYYKVPLSFNMGDLRSKYINYIQEQIENDR